MDMSVLRKWLAMFKNDLLCLFCHSFDAKRPGVVLARTHCDAEPVEFQQL